MQFKKVMIINKINNNNNLITDLEYINLNDSINYLDICKYEAKKKKYCTDKYINSCDNTNNNLGKLITHISILKSFINNINYEWLLVLEDNIELNYYNDKYISDLIEKAILYESKFIQLYTHPQYIHKQIMSQKLTTNLYKLITLNNLNCYLISKEGAKIILSKLPCNDNIDIFYLQLINELNSLCFINNIFINHDN